MKSQLNEASALVSHGQYEDALVLYREIEGALARYGEGGCLLKVGRIKEAKAALEQALALQPDFPKAERLWASIRERGGDASSEHSLAPKREADLVTSLKRAATLTGVILSFLVPLGGVLFFNWDSVMILLLFWLENLILTVFTLLRLACVRGGSFAIPSRKIVGLVVHAIGFSFFFFVHGIITTLAVGLSLEKHPARFFEHVGASIREIVAADAPLEALPISLAALLIPLAVIGTSQAIAFVVYFLLGGGYRWSTPNDEKGPLVLRMIILMAACGFSIPLNEMLQSTVPTAVLLLVLKLMADLNADNSERKRVVRRASRQSAAQ